MRRRRGLHLVFLCLLVGLVVSCTLSWMRPARADPREACAATCGGGAAVLDIPGVDEVEPSFTEREVAACEVQCARFTRACADRTCDLSATSPLHAYGVGAREAGAEPAGTGFDTIMRTCDDQLEGEFKIVARGTPRALRAKLLRQCVSGWVDRISNVGDPNDFPAVVRPLTPEERSAIQEVGQATPDESVLRRTSSA